MADHKKKKKKRKNNIQILIREFDPIKDKPSVEDVERRCEVGSTKNKNFSLFTDLLGDPICRVRHSPAFLMLVAEIAAHNEIVGMIRGCIKTVTCCSKSTRNAGINASDLPQLAPVYTKLAYILGLRVSPDHRLGIGLNLVRRMEEWFREKKAEYSYIATEIDNVASIKLFTHKCGYSKFRTPSILVNPVFAHRLRLSDQVTILQLELTVAETLYRCRFATAEFFPRDIDAVLSNRLSLGTFLAVPRGSFTDGLWVESDRFLSCLPESWAVLSAWNCKDVYALEVRGVSVVKRAMAKLSRVIDRGLPWLRLPSVPEVFKPFGVLFLYGVGGEGPLAGKLMKALCHHAHNLAKERGCGVVATEVSNDEPLKSDIPHWKKLSCPEDLWCIKRLGEGYTNNSLGDWTKSPPSFSIFVDPREF
ncbi:probable N-acetyltransferase HLS1 isoform X2 [Cucurbita moschata]|uniref:Probable N-acetyltransferase HLS1 isoform X2 n=1 Tax=Cucurbita moschata TaxID=3662 RepID=A0A6J1EYB0_CUCMO|nr:probable N-acetyltransferase HLS1 isoform X2 [Cucurbita moschata]